MNKMDTFYIGKNGEVTDKEDKFSGAQVVESAKIVRYYIKHNNRGDLFNPYLSDRETLNRIVNGRKNWEYRKVNKKVFDYYVKFLKTKNINNLVMANRENSVAV